MKKLFLLVVIVSCMAGCALTTDCVVISHTPQANVQKIPEAQNISVAVLIQDNRLDKSNKVSCKKNGFGMEMAPILANENVTLTVKRALETELNARGFSIGKEAAVSLVGELSRFYNDHKPGFFAGDAVAELNLNVVVSKKDGSVAYSRNLTVQEVEANTMLMGGENARRALNKVLDKTLAELFADKDFLAALIAAGSGAAS